jgi:Na+-transporting NADH:ubiquinone oxidoreductase subunit A
MIPVRVTQGYDLNYDGAPSHVVTSLDPPATVAMLPEKIGFVRPRLAVSQGDTVAVGSVLFSDKRNPELVFLSPGGGRIAEIQFGPRRVVRRIVIELASRETYKSFGAVDAVTLAGMDREDLVGRLLAMGFWPRLRALPFRDIAPPEVRPPKIVVSLGGLEPFTPVPEAYLKGREAFFSFGLKVLNRLSSRVVVAAGSGNGDRPDYLKAFPDADIFLVRGPYPALDPGVVVYHTKSDAKENRTWFVSGQDVVMLGQLFRTGRYPVERIMTVAGPMARERRHVRTRLGVPLSEMAGRAGIMAGACRYVVGGLLTGFRSAADGFMGFYEDALNLIPEGNQREFLALFKPGFRKPSFSRTFLSAFNRRPLIGDANTHGELRACIACNHCPPVCPVGILPQLAYKCLLADDVDGALAHGLLDCVECGLCTYVCPSKIDLAGALKTARQTYYKEQEP